MNATEKEPKVRFETTLNGVRRELQKIREADDRLNALRIQLEAAGHPAPALILTDVHSAIHIALEHARNVFREF